MPADHKIEAKNELIVTTWSGEVYDDALIKALSSYQQTVKNKPEYAAFDEIVDFSRGSHFHLSVSGIQRLVDTATSTDVPDVRTKLAIVVNSPVAFTLARMYQAYRSFIPRGMKTLRIFRTVAEARKWVEER